VTAVLPERAGELRGRLRFVDSAVDANSGTVKVKAVFDNPAHRLWPGAYVNVRLGVETLRDVVVVPQAAVVQGASARSLFIVGADGKARQRVIDVLQSSGSQAVVAGLEGGEAVVVDGRQNLRPGVAVTEAASAGAGRAPQP
jgi:RND family efflux transporter MFP subunit